MLATMGEKPMSRFIKVRVTVNTTNSEYEFDREVIDLNSLLAELRSDYPEMTSCVFVIVV